MKGVPRCVIVEAGQHLPTLCELDEGRLRSRPKSNAGADIDRILPGFEFRECESVEATFEHHHARGGFRIAEDRDGFHTALGEARGVLLPILFPALLKPYDIAGLGVPVREVDAAKSATAHIVPETVQGRFRDAPDPAA